MLIPYQQLSPEALQGIIEAQVTQQGADQFDTTYSLQDKSDQVLAQLKSGQLVIVFDGVTESCNIVAKDSVQFNDTGSET